MEKVVLLLCGVWFWLTRKYRAKQYREAAEVLNAAHDSLEEDLWSWWSTRDRGYVLPNQAEALSILKHYSTLTVDTAKRFDSLLECCRFVAEELAGVPIRAAQQPQAAPVLLPTAAIPVATFRFFWNSEGSGAAPQPFPLVPLRLKQALAPAEVPHSRAA
jgi:hypothetical protein